LEILLATAEGRALQIRNSTMRYDVDDLQVLGLLEGANRLSNECSKLFESIRPASTDLTESPPRSNEGMNEEIGGTIRAEQEGRP
jgi:hypothetical protein